MLSVFKRTVSMRRFFEQPKHMFKPMDKKIFTFLRWNFLLNWPYHNVPKSHELALVVSKNNYLVKFRVSDNINPSHFGVVYQFFLGWRGWGSSLASLNHWTYCWSTSTMKKQFFWRDNPTSLILGLLGNFLVICWFFQNQLFFEKFFQEHHQGVKQFGSRSDPTNNRAWSES